MSSAIYITRCDIGWYSKNANAYRKPLEVASKYDTTLCVDETCRIPKEIADKCAGIVRFKGLCGLLRGEFLTQRCKDAEVFSGFDFPCMFKAWLLKRKYGCHWTLYLWDPPCLLLRDKFPLLRRVADAAFRFFARRCDRLVLNIHPGLLDEIGYRPREGQLEQRMQDAWANVCFSREEHAERADANSFDYDFGVLANWSKAKGSSLMSEALAGMPGRKCLWIGNVPKGQTSSSQIGQIEFAGRLPQADAFALLRKCRVLVVPYLPTHAFKWNYPLKLFEYLELGRPILASDNPGNAAIAKRYPGKIDLFKSGDVDDFVAKTSHLLGAGQGHEGGTNSATTTN